MAMSPADDGDEKGEPGSLRAFERLVDPATDWVLGEVKRGALDKKSTGPGVDYFFLPERKNQFWLPILVGLKDIAVQDFAAGVQFDKLAKADLLKKQWMSCTVFSPLDTEGPFAAERSFYCAPTVTKVFFYLLNQIDELREVVTNVTLGLPLDWDSLPKLPDSMALEPLPQ
jgi:hypothetical protein